MKQLTWAPLFPSTDARADSGCETESSSHCTRSSSPVSFWKTCPRTDCGGLAHLFSFPGGLGKPCHLPKYSLISELRQTAVGPRSPPGGWHRLCMWDNLWESWSFLRRVSWPTRCLHSGWRNKTSGSETWYLQRRKMQWLGRSLTSAGRSR